MDHLKNLSFKNKNVHISAIKDYFEKNNFLDNLKDLAEKLKNFKFIKKSKTNEILCTEEFYDPQVPFFKILFDNNPEKFPTQPYDTDAWLSFLRLIGLQGIEILNDVNLIKDYLT
jgi:hypothetical protein